MSQKNTRQPQKIAICYCDTPLIWTFVFSGAEYWCPSCGNNYGMMGVKKVELTPELKFQQIINTAATSKYLHAKAVFACVSMKIKGVDVKRADFPQSMLDKATKIIHEYESR